MPLNLILTLAEQIIQLIPSGTVFGNLSAVIEPLVTLNQRLQFGDAMPEYKILTAYRRPNWSTNESNVRL